MGENSIIHLKEGEEIISIVRASAWHHMPRFMLAGIWICSPFFFMFPLLTMGHAGYMIFLGLITTGAWYSFREWVMWHMTMMIITNKRMIDIEQDGLVSRKAYALTWEDIRDIRIVKRGKVRKILKIGTLRIRGKKLKKHDIEFKGIENIGHIKNLLNEVKSHHNALIASKHVHKGT